jgi:hypothetical protein
MKRCSFTEGAYPYTGVLRMESCLEGLRVYTLGIEIETANAEKLIKE